MATPVMVEPRTEREQTSGDWRIVALEELRSLWLEGRALTLLFGMSLLLSVVAYLVAVNGDLTLLSQQETVQLVVKVAIAVGAVLALVMCADAISGERETGTLEVMLLSPLSGRAIAAGKLAAYLTVWPAAYVMSIVYIAALAKGSGIFGDAVITSGIAGTLLVVAFACLGITISSLSNSNRFSLSVSLFVFIALLAPSQLPGGALKGSVGNVIERTNPMTAAAHYVDTVLIDNHAWTRDLDWLASPAIAAVLMIALAVFVTGRLRLGGGLSD
jgi:ABC-2 type transport system permease protein